MPLHKSDGTQFPLNNEMAERDFQWKGNWERFCASFTSPEYSPAEADDAYKETLSHFLNDLMCGPFYVMETGAKTRERFSVIVFHPDDWDKCQKILGQDKWKAKPDSVPKNLAIIGQQIHTGFQPDNLPMFHLLQAAGKEMMENGGSLSRNGIETLMRKVWGPQP